MEKDLKKLLKSLTLEEKALFLSGAKTMETKEFPEKGIPPLRMTDGPNGVRKINDNNEPGFDLNEALPATSFPLGSLVSCSWDLDLYRRIGEAIAKECLAYRVDVLLGPAINIKRNQLCGRNFEYLSEDPLLAGKLACSYIQGVQSQNVIACPKHFACNNNEKWRTVGDSIVDERALREIYLKPFEIAVREGHAKSIMTSYNRINGTYAAQNELLFKALRDEWGFDGFAMTDWGGIDEREIGLKVGQDLEMPGCTPSNVQRVIDAYHNGVITMEEIDTSVYRILKAISDTRDNPKVDKSVFEKHQQLAIEAANESMVLLKNKNKLLPLSKDKKYAIIGEYFERPRFQGGGSSLINNSHYIRPLDTFNKEGISYTYSAGFHDNEDYPNKELEDLAIESAKDADIVLLFVGQSDYEECESYDRESMRLPQNQLSLISRVKELNKPIVVLLFGGSSTEVPYEDDVDSILFVGLPGECSGVPIYETLFGLNNPSGKVSETWTMKYEDNPSSKDFSSCPKELYKESIYVGYRYYDTKGMKVRYPFGYGLSYVTYTYSDFKVSDDKNNINVTLKIKNNGEVAGKEIVQVYIHKDSDVVFRPNKELKGFAKVLLKPHEEKEVKISIHHADLMIYDVGHNRWVLEDGKYEVLIGKNVRDIEYKEEVNIKGEIPVGLPKEKCLPYFDINRIDNLTKKEFEDLYGKEIPDYVPAKKPYTMYTPISEMNSLFGRVLQNLIRSQGIKAMKEADNETDPLVKRRKKMNGYMASLTVVHCCLRFLCYSSSGALTLNEAEGMLDIANGHPFRGRKKMRGLKAKL
ncbi:MAG: glycoside hydrolase family 3 C-terminal domain-containing protein [Bacilli bacterium]|nr:glycoside hydrolase family 3 C-terminal domain-containing protein [Bacilli bacterium]